MGPATRWARRLDAADARPRQVLAGRPPAAKASRRQTPPPPRPRPTATPPQGRRSSLPLNLFSPTPNPNRSLPGPQAYRHAPRSLDTPPELTSHAPRSSLAILPGTGALPRPALPIAALTLPGHAPAKLPLLFRQGSRPPPRLLRALEPAVYCRCSSGLPSVRPGFRELCPRPFSVLRPKQGCEGSSERVAVSTPAPQTPGRGPLPGRLRPRPSWKWEVGGRGKAAHGAGPGVGSRAAERIDGTPLSSSWGSLNSPREYVGVHLNAGYRSLTLECPPGIALASAPVKRAFLITNSLRLVPSAVVRKLLSSL